MDSFSVIFDDILKDSMNTRLIARGYTPLYAASNNARVVIIGQAPGAKAQAGGRAWDDASGMRLRRWLGVNGEQFYDSSLISLLPMDFFYPGKAPTHGDLPPRKGFADKWHPRLLACMPNVQLILLVGAYAQRHYLGARAKPSLTETVRSYSEYLPEYFPLVHPSPLNFRWRVKNPWFESDVVPVLRRVVGEILA